MARSLSFQLANRVHPSAHVDPSAKLGAHVFFAGAVVQPDAVIGDHVIVTRAPRRPRLRRRRLAHLAPACTSRLGACREGAFSASKL